MWNEPYLETCCRSALHRLALVGAAGRPAGLADQPCLERLRGMGLARERGAAAAAGGGGRFEITDEGAARHARDVLRRGSAA
jgi:hypothetical protein